MEVRGGLRRIDSIGRRVICLHSYTVNYLRDRYIGIFMSRRRRLLRNSFRKALVSRVTSVPQGTCGTYRGVTITGVCQDGSIISVRLTNCRIVDALLRLVVSTMYGPRGACSGLLVGQISPRCSVLTRHLCSQLVTILSCVSKVASICTLSLCQGAGNVDLPVMWRGRSRIGGSLEVFLCISSTSLHRSRPPLSRCPSPPRHQARH